MVAAEDKGVAGPALNRFHAPPIGLDASGIPIIKPRTVQRAPVDGVELEVSAAPLMPQSVEERFQELLDVQASADRDSLRAALEDLRAGRVTRYGDVDALMQQLDRDDRE